MYFLKRWPFVCVPLPAAQHDGVKWVWTQDRLGQVDLHHMEYNMTALDLQEVEVFVKYIR